MSVIGHSPLAGASGAAGGADPLYVDDVFSIDLYRNDSTTEEFNNGLDMAGEGGLIVTTFRDLGTNRAFVDSERGVSKVVYGDSTGPESTAQWIQSFDDDGFTHGSYIGTGNNSGVVSWSFRKAPGFFDVVTYTGNGSTQNIAHSLGSVPGMIMIHCRDGTHDWEVYHRSTGATKSLHLNKTDAAATDSTVWNNTTPTSSVFTVGTSSNVNQNGHGYVAYIFAHDEQSFGTNSDEAIIKCGSYTGNGSTNGPEVNLGFEPQFLLSKNITQGLNWEIIDVWRGMPRGQSNDYMKVLTANTDASESTDFSTYPTPTGFKITNNGGSNNASGNTYIYMAIRRPHKPPTAGTEVFKAIARAGTSSNVSVTGVGFSPDSYFCKIRSSGNTYQNLWFDRLRAPGTYIKPATNAQENTSSNIQLSFDQDGVTLGNGNNANGSSLNYINYFFKRAPGFFDVVPYTGTGGVMTINHNLGVSPELLIVKRRSSDGTWWTYSSVTGNNAFMRLEGTFQADSPANLWNYTTPSSTTFSLGNNNNVVSSGVTHIAYLFATQSGVSKVGSYSGTGSNINVDCGFTSGARFVMIKRTDSAADWYFWDTARGIVSGNDPYLLFNSVSAEVTNTDYIDPLNAGFTVTSSAPAALNASGGTYLFLAIA